MRLGGLQKTSLIDFPGRVGCTVFTVGCNFGCGFCHNKDLVSLERFKQSGMRLVKEEELFKFLKKRKEILDGVCITGGEPTLQPDLIEFCKKIKELELEVKLDTNGSNPEALKKLIEKKLIDFIAMDVKTDWQEYDKAAGTKVVVEKIKRSARLILKSGLEYELRTTVVPGIHNLSTLMRLAKELRGLNKDMVWVWQQFRPKNCLDPAFLNKKPYTKKQLSEFLSRIVEILPSTKIRD